MQSNINGIRNSVADNNRQCLVQSNTYMQKKCNNITINTCKELSDGLKTETKHQDSYEEYDLNKCLLRSRLKKNIVNSSKSLLQKAEMKKTGIDCQLEESKKKLESLISYGNELVYNIKIANEKRESLRRQYEFSRRQDLQQNSRNELIQSTACFLDITSKWSELKSLKEPIELSEKIKEHNFYVSDIMKKKDDIIDQCQNGINCISDIYYSDKEKQSNDLSCLVERIDNQIELLKDAYNQHFGLLHNTIQNERLNIEFSASMKWKKFYDEMLKNEKTKFLIVKEKESFYSREISRICAEQEAITRRSRIRLEKDAEMLQWELLKTRNVVLMTSEKLDYNYQVLQKRNEENVIINNQQKRRVGRLNEYICSLKKKLIEAKVSTEISISKLNGDIEKLHSNINDLEKKSTQFRRNNENKYTKISEMNVREMQRIITKVFKIDRILYHQELTFPWIETKIDFNIDYDILRKQSMPDACKTKNLQLLRSADIINSRALKYSYCKISDRAAFLVDDKLLHILEPFGEEENCLVRLDNIFTALGIDDTNNIAHMTRFFRPYCWCPYCGTNPPEALADIFKIGSDLDDISLQYKNILGDHKKLQQNVLQSKKLCANHYLVIEPTFVLTALKRYTKQHSIEAQIIKRNLMAIHGISREISIDKAVIAKFWSNLSSLVSADNETLWISLEHGFIHYLDELKSRQQLNNKCKYLRNQNNELIHMLKQIN